MRLLVKIFKICLKTKYGRPGDSEPGDHAHVGNANMKVLCAPSRTHLVRRAFVIIGVSQLVLIPLCLVLVVLLDDLFGRALPALLHRLRLLQFWGEFKLRARFGEAIVFTGLAG